MKTNEFIKAVEELGYEVFDEVTCFEIIDTDGLWLAVVRKDHLLSFSTEHVGWGDLDNREKTRLFMVIYDYASTPPDKREEEKKFYLKHRYFKYPNGEEKFFNINLDSNAPSLKWKSNSEFFKTQFTQKEIDEIKEKHHTDLSDFERVEVEE